MCDVSSYEVGQGLVHLVGGVEVDRRYSEVAGCCW